MADRRYARRLRLVAQPGGLQLAVAAAGGTVEVQRLPALDPGPEVVGQQVGSRALVGDQRLAAPCRRMDAVQHRQVGGLGLVGLVGVPERGAVAHVLLALIRQHVADRHHAGEVGIAQVVEHVRDRRAPALAEAHVGRPVEALVAHHDDAVLVERVGQVRQQGVGRLRQVDAQHLDAERRIRNRSYGRHGCLPSGVLCGAPFRAEHNRDRPPLAMPGAPPALDG